MFEGVADVIAISGHTANVQRSNDAGRGASGAQLHTWSTVLAGWRCWFQPASSALQEMYGKQGFSVTHAAYGASDPGIEAGDRLYHDGRYFLVRGYVNEAELGKLFVIICEEQ